MTPDDVAILRIHGGILRWRIVAGVAGYKLQYKLHSDSDWLLLASHDGSGSPLISTAIDGDTDRLDIVPAGIPDGNYNFRIVAVSSDGTESDTPTNCLFNSRTNTAIAMPNLPIPYFAVIEQIASPSGFDLVVAIPESSYTGLTIDVEWNANPTGSDQFNTWIAVGDNTSDREFNVPFNFIFPLTGNNNLFFRTRSRLGSNVGSFGNVGWHIRDNPATADHDSELAVSYDIDSRTATYTFRAVDESVNAFASLFRTYFLPITGEANSSNGEFNALADGLTSFEYTFDDSGIATLIDGYTVSGYEHQPEDIYCVAFELGRQQPDSPVLDKLVTLPFIGGKQYPPPPPPDVNIATPTPVKSDFSDKYVVEVWNRTGTELIADITKIVTKLSWQTKRNGYPQIKFSVDSIALEQLAERNGIEADTILPKYERLIKLKRNGDYLLAAMLTQKQHADRPNGTTINTTSRGLLFLLLRRRTATNLVFSNSQVSAICWSMIQATQTASDLGITQAIGNYSPLARDRTYKRTKIAEAIIALTRLATGKFDFEITPDLKFKTYEAGATTDNLKTDVLIHHSRMSGLTVDDRGDKIANVVIAISSGQTVITKTAENLASIAKYGRLEKVITVNDVIQESTVQEHATAEVNNLAEGAVIVKFSLPDGILDLNQVGVRNYIPAQLPPRGGYPEVANFFRIEKLDVKVDSNGGEKVTLTLDAGLSTADVQQQLDEIDVQQILENTRNQVEALGTNS